MKKVIQTVMLLIYLMPSFAQSDTVSLVEMKQEILKTNSFYKANQLDLRGYDFSNPGLNQVLYAAAISKKKSKHKASTGSIFIGLGLATAIYSIAVVESVDNTGIPASSTATIGGGILFGAGVAAISIPFYISSGKHKKEAEKHVKLAREMYGG